MQLPGLPSQFGSTSVCFVSLNEPLAMCGLSLLSWFTVLMNHRTSESDFGFSISRIADVFCGSAEMLFLSMTGLRTVTRFLLYSHLLSVRPATWIFVRVAQNLTSCSCWVGAKTSASSTWHITPSRISLILLWKWSSALEMPTGIL